MSDDEVYFEKYPYAVILFNDLNSKKIKKNKFDVDLVPHKWINGEPGNYFCKYPSPAEYNHRDEFLRTLADPNPTWLNFPVTILKKAKDLQQGYRRLERSYKRCEIESTDTENNAGLEYEKIKKLNDVQSLEDFSSNCDIMKEESQVINSPSITLDEFQSFENTMAVREPQLIGSDGVIEEPQLIENTTYATYDIDFEKTLDTIFDDKLNRFRSEMVTYFDENMQKYYEKTKNDINNAKRSILRDFDSKNDEINNSIARLSHNNPINVVTEEEIRNSISVTLPITDLDEFLQFDIKLQNYADEKNLLELFYKKQIGSGSDIKKCVHNLLALTFTKNVQCHYSGTGRIIGGVGKKNFSATTVYKTMLDALKSTYRIEDIDLVRSIVSKWLSGVSDREGGRSNRRKLHNDVCDSGNVRK